MYGSISLSKMDRVYIILAGCHGDSNCIYSIFKLSDFIFTILHKSTKKLALKGEIYSMNDKCVVLPTCFLP